jgi:hypothetical protein
MDGGGQFGYREGQIPRSLRPTPHADLRDDHEVVGIGMQRLADQVVGDMGQ